MVLPLILANPLEKKDAKSDGSAILNVAEMFGETVQGEGLWTGVPATFLRLQGCTLACSWCDTLEVWKSGNPYSCNEIMDIMRYAGVVDDLKNGHHLVLTGGSPLKQEKSLQELLMMLYEEMGHSPFVEIENECVLKPSNLTIGLVSHWNNSPKLSNSGMPKAARYKLEVLRDFSDFENVSWKFVVSNIEDWNEIVEDFIKPGICRRDKIFLMPEGVTRDQLQGKYEWLVDLCCRENVRMSDRMHVTIWNKKTGV